MSLLRIAVIPAPQGQDYLVDTIFDGLATLSGAGILEYSIVTEDSVTQARMANLILLLSNKLGVRSDLTEKVDRWEKTVYIDGSELGKDNRYDVEIQKGVLAGTYVGRGAISQEMLKKCALYFRREKPYVHGIIPLPFGIERRYIHYRQGQKKDIDFACIFGQDEHPSLRRKATEFLEQWCKQNNFTCATKQTNSLFNRDVRNEKSQDKFYDILARTKVGISIGGGGFDTLRFWEVLGNNCALLTETIDIFEPHSPALNYKRIFQFKNLTEFEDQLNKLGSMIKTPKWKFTDDTTEYKAILGEHSTKARVLSVIQQAQKKGIV